MRFFRSLRAVNPLKRVDDNTKTEYIIQIILAFVLIFITASILMEIIVILIFYILGYNLIEGEIPSGTWADFVPLYGFLGFGLITLLYVKKIEKRDLSAINVFLNLRSLIQFIVNFLWGLVLVGMFVFILVTTGQFEFLGFGSIDGTFLILGLLAYVIQGTTEELMTRGFLQNSLDQRTSTATAIFISALFFSLPHLLSVMEMEGIIAVVSLVNLLLVSILFSLAMIKDNSLASVAGLHVGWNFCLSLILGLQVSGGDSVPGLLQFASRSTNELLTGGNYGIEASILLMPVLILLNLVYIMLIKGRKAHEI